MNIIHWLIDLSLHFIYKNVYRRKVQKTEKCKTNYSLLFLEKVKLFFFRKK